MQDEFGIKLNPIEVMSPKGAQDTSILKMKQYVENLDPVALCCMFQIAAASQSSIIAWLLVNGHFTPEEAVKAARIEEDYQTSKNGMVEGAHDLDEANLGATFSTAKTIVNFALLREI